MIPKRGKIYLATLPVDGHQQTGIRPVIVTQNDKGCVHSPRVHVVPLSSRINKARHLPTHVLIMPTVENGLSRPSIAVAEGLVSIQKENLIREFGAVCPADYDRVAEAIRIHLAVEV